MTIEDIFYILHLLRATDGALQGTGLNGMMPAEVAAISAFTKADNHYMYTLDPQWPLDYGVMSSKEELNDNTDDQAGSCSYEENTGANLDSEGAA